MISLRLFEFGHLVSIAHALHYMNISKYGQPEALTRPPNSLGSAILLSGFIAPFVSASASILDMLTRVS
jgi:hypothetical protein